MASMPPEIIPQTSPHLIPPSPIDQTLPENPNSLEIQNPGFKNVPNETNNIRSWSSILKTTQGSAGREKLQFVEPIFENGILQIEDEILEEGIEEWKDTLVGYFVDEKVSPSLVKNFLTNRWRLLGEVEIRRDEDLYYFTFYNKEDREKVLEEGSIHISGKYFVICPWSENIEKDKNCIKSIPLWVKFMKLPKQIWNGKGISRLASSIGKPMFMDKCTEERKVLAFAGVCIEVQATQELPDSINIKVSKTASTVVNVEYSWKPKICTYCQSFGHEINVCNKNPEAIPPPPQPPITNKIQNQSHTNCPKTQNFPQKNAQQPPQQWNNRGRYLQNVNWREKERGETSRQQGNKNIAGNKFNVLQDCMEEGEIIEVEKTYAEKENDILEVSSDCERQEGENDIVSSKESEKEDEQGKNVADDQNRNQEDNEIIEQIINREREGQSLVVETQNATDVGTREAPQLNEITQEVVARSENVASKKTPIQLLSSGVNFLTPVRGLSEISPTNSAERMGITILDENSRVGSQVLKETEGIRKRWEERQQKEKGEAEKEEDLAKQRVESSRMIKQKGKGTKGKTKTMKLSTITDREQQTLEEEIEDGEPLKNFLL